jgi:methyl-accepting chemotaxis protein
MKLTVGKRILASFASMLGLSLIASYYAIVTVRDVKGVADHVLTRSAKALDIVGALNTGLANARFAQRGVILYSMAKDPKEVSGQIQKLQTELEGAQASVNRLRPLLDTEKKLQTLGRFEEALHAYAQLSREIVDQATAGRTDDAVAILKGKSKPFGAAMETSAAELAAGERDWMNGAVGVVQSTCRRGDWIQFSCVIALAVCGGIVFLVTRAIIRSLRGCASEVANVAEQVRSAAFQVASGSQSLAQDASEQAASLQGTSTAGEQISKISLKNASAAQAVAHQSDQVESKIRLAEESLTHMVASMHQIDGSSTKISKIIRVIDDIAFQTNILALNAAVEAARAGVAGAGFAVVAGEVRNLAQRCAGAASETTALIEESIASTVEGRKNVGRVAESVQALAGSATTVKTLADEVNRGCQEQTRGADQISRSVSELNRVMQDVAANAEESAAASQEMSSQAEMMARIGRDMRGLVDSRG